MTHHKDAHEDDLRALPLTARELEVCMEALANARGPIPEHRNAMGPYSALVGVMQSMVARLRSERSE